ncbi:DNA polymerase III subunit delta' [Terrilactibacillus sp. BCM23-1]|uniref:DNA polymerase III subunit delta n=1 Tax=Terrilactibacillus tamarindi TaxID=2599694 RepID=A0A6N8CUZ1_9BACI|nr:DNA polymerase III subunit delta' [Terrilactibacillus tamarindi]MTT32965.1 DNA polymerase III subunit delta' [Terrilactibacillus tamarindi]
MSWKAFIEKQKTAATIFTHALRKNELSHAYILEGPKGTGKREMAQLLAQTLFCENRKGTEPCHECRNCRRVLSGNHPDIVWVKKEEDATLIKKEQITYLIKEFAYRSVESQMKLFIIEDADLMSSQAANSLLKFIEEPHQNTVALLLTEHIHQLLDTIISRCQVLTFSALSRKNLEEKLIEQGISKPLATLSSSLTNRYDEAISYCKDEWFANARLLVIQLVQKLLNSTQAGLSTMYEHVAPHFKDQKQWDIALDLLLFWYRDMMSIHLDRLGEVVYCDKLDELKSQTLQKSLQHIADDMAYILKAKRQLLLHVNGLSVMEELIVKLQGEA